MKKSLLAVAAMTAFAGAAQAQSSVTVYGILDMGYIGANEKATVDGVTAKQQVSQFGQSAQSNSRLGFKGVEDLGGGLSAFFTFETLLTPQGSNYTTSANRQSFVGLGKKGIGRASIGTQYTTIHNAIAKTDPGQLNNIAGNLINPQNAGIGNANGSDGNTAAYTVRASNMLALQSDNFAGFQGNAFYVQNNQNSTETASNSAGVSGAGGTVNNTGYGLGVDYTWKKLLVTANYQSFKGENNTSGNAVTVSGTTGGITPVNATDNQMYFAATYDFGILKAYANYIDRKITSSFDSNAYIKRSAQQIGVRSFITPKVEAWASGGTGRFTADGAASPTVNFNGWQLGSNYWLSKRTNLYAIYGQELTSNSNVAGLNANYGLSNYAVGVRHTF
jgi:predicted porin